ncbi:putative ABC transporter ATP-binding protein [Nocardia brasiliensis NBRC 14402]|uniref:daunorubicin resistance protein DrrA family ABC transporter ATP-binding protein n=1 Tax=Nocardia brasiliensis TaxID=37326 RepID=UPI0002D59F53|nr:daunorubicin resistance protein DrrA family ABC transporter ATP-binding protein [Nocardia brasiliensis]GAJ83343.1 putative ABC transporter ATP-binding protein [Nocardia brasiliensis NBRC 14402]SUB10367.1 Daunorubicin/doxorubicin resistance ATP-binding protein DrrA [Nocardia brasiliensis]
MVNGHRAPAISAVGLRKAFGEQVVLDGIDIVVPEGTIYSLLGPNGAGKTTTVQILSTLIHADGGELRVGGYDVAAERASVRETIGVTGQFAAVDELLTGRENLLLMGDLHHLPRRDTKRLADDLLARFDLVEAADKPASTYSGGMTRRLDLAMTLVGDPRIIFLDEPTTGLDPRSRRVIWELIRGLVDDYNVTVFLTTQYLEEADQLADRIAVLDHGRIVAEGTAAELKRMVPGGHIRLQFAVREDLFAASAALGVAARIAADDEDEDLTLAVPSDGSVKSLRAVLDRLDYEQIEVEGLAVHTPNLDDVFLTLTGQPTSEKETVA